MDATKRAANRAAVARYRARHPERVAEQNARYRAAKRLSGKQQACDRARYAADPLAENQRNRAYRAANPDKERERNRRWRHKNPGVAAAKVGRRRARLATGTGLSWFDRAEIAAIYDISKARSVQTGVPHHVDHVVPLAKGGPHHPRNLQVLVAQDNQRKGAKWPVGA